MWDRKAMPWKKKLLLNMSVAHQTHYISFAGQEVAIRSEDPEAIEPFLFAFREMLVTDPVDLLATLTVCRDGDGYRIDGAKRFEGERETPRSVLQQLKFEVIHRFVDEHPELLWLHAGAAASEQKAVLLCGTWGSGKSTLVGNLCSLGWTYLSDDIVPIEMAAGQLVSFPLTPMMRAHSKEESGVQLTPVEVSNLEKQVVELDKTAYAKHNMDIAAIIFPKYDPQVTKIELRSISPASATLELLRNCLDLKFHQEEAVHFLGGLIETLPVYMLRYDDGKKAAAMLAKAHAKGFV